MFLILFNLQPKQNRGKGGEEGFSSGFLWNSKGREMEEQGDTCGGRSRSFHLINSGSEPPVWRPALPEGHGLYMRVLVHEMSSAFNPCLTDLWPHSSVACRSNPKRKGLLHLYCTFTDRALQSQQWTMTNTINPSWGQLVMSASVDAAGTVWVSQEQGATSRQVPSELV